MGSLLSSLSLTWLLLAAHPAAGGQHDGEGHRGERDEASEAFKRGDYGPAATSFDALWIHTGEPRDLFNAGLAHFAAGEHALAVLRLEQYLALGDRVPVDHRARAEAQLARARQHTVAVAIAVTPGAALGEGTNLTGARAATPAGLPARTIDFPAPRSYGQAARAVTTIHVDPGPWTFTLAVPGYLPATRSMTVASGQSGFTMDVELQPDPNSSARTVVFQLDGSPAVGDVQVDAVPAVGTSGQPRGCLIVAPPSATAGPCQLQLEQGSWQISARGPGIAPYSGAIDVGAEPTYRFALPVTAVATPEGPEMTRMPGGRPTGVPPEVRVKLSRALTIAGAVTAATGLVILVVGDVQYGNAESDIGAEVASGLCNAAREDGDTCQARLINPIHMRAAGMGMLGGAAGLLAAGVTGRYDVRPRAWYIEIGVGSALTIGGLVWLAARNAALSDQLMLIPAGVNDVARVGSLTTERMAASFFLGGGVGLTAGAVTGLLVQRKVLRGGWQRAQGLTPLVGPRFVGLSLGGQF
ncbi:MAG: hypothetical protein R3A51_22290 [Nannocystaceae bacterium]|nr:hypothetical protein [Myxococcales bacterium]